MDLVQQMDSPDFRAEFLLDHKHQAEPGHLQPNWRWMDWAVEWTDGSLLEVTVVEATHFTEPTAM